MHLISDDYPFDIQQQYYHQNSGGGYKNSNAERIFCKCGRTFLYKHLYNYHEKWECGKTLQCTIINCMKTFKRISNLKSHMRTCSRRQINEKI